MLDRGHPEYPSVVISTETLISVRQDVREANIDMLVFDTKWR